MKFLEIIIKMLLNIILILATLLLIMVAYNFVSINILKHKYTNFFGYTFFEVETGSMSGTIEVDDIVLVKITQDVAQNDIITFEQDDSIITHRIIEKDEESINTKGDANNSEDSPIKKEQVIGKVIKVFSRLGIWRKVLSESRVIVSIIITILLFGLAVSSETSDTKNKTNEKNRKEKHSFSRFMRNRREKRNGKSKKKKRSKT